MTMYIRYFSLWMLTIDNFIIMTWSEKQHVHPTTAVSRSRLVELTCSSNANNNIILVYNNYYAYACKQAKLSLLQGR